MEKEDATTSPKHELPICIPSDKPLLCEQQSDRAGFGFRVVKQLSDGRLLIRDISVQEKILPQKDTIVYEDSVHGDTFGLRVIEPLPNGNLRVADLSQGGIEREVSVWREKPMPR